MRYLFVLTAIASLFLVSDVSAEPVAGGTFVFELRIPDEGGDPDVFALRDAETVTRFFNTASCLCGSAFEVRTTLEGGGAADDREVQIWAGNGCDSHATDAERRAACVRVGSITEADDLNSTADDQLLTVDQLVPANPTCDPLEQTQGVYYLIDDDVANDATWACTGSVAISVDTQEPKLPEEVVATPGEAAINISWKASSETGINHYQALCKRSIGDPVAGEFGDAPEYITSNTLCNTAGSLTPYNYAAKYPLLPTELANLDPAFVCGTASGTETSLRIEGLADKVSYHVVLIAIDNAGNPSELVYLDTVTPQPVRDFWEHYRGEGGDAQGGVCLANSTYGGNHPFTTAMRDFRDDVLASSAMGRAITVAYYDYVAPLGAHVDNSLALRILAMVVLFPLVILAAFFAYVPGVLQLLLFGWLAWRMLRRRYASSPRRGSMLRPAWLGAAAMVGVLAVPAVASAQAYTPYWASFESDDDSRLGPGRVRWNLNLKLGPYFPDIDKKVSGAAPYAETFGDTDSLMFAVDLDRFFLYPGGQLGVSFSLGVMSASANAFQLSSDGTAVAVDSAGNPLRAAGEKTRFRLIPSSVSAIYRFTSLDRKMRIPLVPYGKLGLAYNLWWITKPGDSTARVRIDPECVGSSCPTTRALGASLGVTATLGIAIRAERIDKQAATNLRNDMNIHHAGFFAELSYSKVDGFGSDKKLSVGDATWYAGVNFEF